MLNPPVKHAKLPFVGSDFALQNASLSADVLKTMAANQPLAVVGVATRLLAIGLLMVASVLSAGAEPPQWLQPTLVGMLWAGLFLVGFACGSFARGNVLYAIYSACLAILSNSAFHKLTSLFGGECLLITSLVLLVGWAAANFDPATRRAYAPQTEPAPILRVQIWDIAYLTVLVALVCRALPELESLTVLMATALVAVLASLPSCWAASRWAWDDHWTGWKVAAMAATVSVAIGVVFYHSPMPPATTLRWLLAGPMHVIAAQATTVLLFCSAMRFDQFAKIDMKPAQEPAPTTNLLRA